MYTTKRKAYLFMIIIVLIISTLFIVKTAKCDEKKSINFPTKPVHVIVARGSGGSTDAVARTLQPYFSKYLGRPVVVENVPGAHGKIGNKKVYDSDPDGYTLLFGVTLSDILNEVVEGGTAYEMRKFTPIYNISGIQASIIIASIKSGIKTLDQLIKKAKKEEIVVAQTGGINVATLGLTLLKDSAGIPRKNITTIPYKSSAGVIPAVLGGHAMIGIPQPTNVPPLLAQGKLYALVVFSKNRLDYLPDVPTFNETYPGIYYSQSTSIFAPPGTAGEIIKVLEASLKKAVSDSDFIKKAKGRFIPEPMNASELKESIKLSYELAKKYKKSLLDLGKK